MSVWDEGDGCELAVLDGKSYFVDGSSIDSHGDAPVMVLSAIRMEVTGKVVDNKFSHHLN
jgi:hypothetical protein